MVLARTLQLRPEPLPAEGDLASTPFPVLLGWARANRTTGVLAISDEKFVFLLRGTPVHVESVLADDTSEVYLRTRVPAATDDQKLATARATAQKTGRGVGEAMLGLGWLDPSELFEHKKAHAQEKLISCFNPRAGAVRFEARDSLGADLVPIPLDVAAAMREGFGRFYDRTRLDRELPVDDLCRVSVSEDASAQGGVATEDARLLRLCAGRPTLRTLATAAGLRPDDLKRRLYGLYCLGLVAFELGAPIAEESPAEQRMPHPFPVPKTGGASAAPGPPAAPTPRPPARTPSPPATAAPRPAVTTPRPAVTTPRPAVTTPRPAVTTPRPLGTTPPVPSTPRPAPEATPHPPTSRRTPLATPRPPTPLGTPRPVASPTPTREARPDASPSPAAAIAAIEAAELARANDELADAVEILRAADRELPNEPRILAELALTLVLFDERKYAKEANRLAREARKAAPSLPLPYVVMGILLEHIHETEQASQMFRHALARDPDCAEASRRLETLVGDVKATK